MGRARDSQGADQTLSPPPAGSYSGASGGYSLRLYVSPDRTRIQDVTVTTSLGCAPGGSLGGQFQLADTKIEADGSFTSTFSYEGVVASSPATIKYTFSGHFHGTNGAGTARVAGNLREDVTYDDGSVRSCTTNNLSWSAPATARAPIRRSSPPPAGSYSGASGGYSLRLFVSPDRTQIQDVTVTTSLGCRPGSGLGGEFQFPDIAIAADGSFSSTYRTRAWSATASRRSSTRSAATSMAPTTRHRPRRRQPARGRHL